MAGMIRPEALMPDIFREEAAHVRALAAALRNEQFFYECYRQVLMLYGELYRSWPRTEVHVRVAYGSYLWIGSHWSMLAPLLERLLAANGTAHGYRLDWEATSSPDKEPISVTIRARPA